MKKKITSAQEAVLLLFDAVFKKFPKYKTLRYENVHGFGLVKMSDIIIRKHTLSIGLHVEENIPVFILFSHDEPEHKNPPLRNHTKPYRHPAIYKVYGGKYVMGHLGGKIVHRFSDAIYISGKELKIKSSLSYEIAAIAEVNLVLDDLIKDQEVGMGKKKLLEKSDMLDIPNIKRPPKPTY